MQSFITICCCFVYNDFA